MLTHTTQFNSYSSSSFSITTLFLFLSLNMARLLIKSLSFCFFILLLASIFYPSQARPLNVLKSSHSSVSGGGILEGLFLGAVKDSGPSPCCGNGSAASQTLGYKESGPSPGQGN
ncbi:hypothetical protein LOK49_LG01G03238 [Camellia lanceoleosa]|uniref:Uncharacterized protein n=2 Tax=Camellia lanceoleosa TaxID=1840588 RepID=A0ACC0J2W1_9ERIC|nr:hypothetical protein LOK49_LG01G03238 [Camellia lanceoleosa]